MKKSKIKETDEVKEILEVDVSEVSLVDKAAIMRDFLVLKRMEEDMKTSAFDDEKIVSEVVKREDIETPACVDGKQISDDADAKNQESGSVEKGEQVSQSENSEKNENSELKSDSVEKNEDSHEPKKPEPAVQMFEDGTIVVKGQAVRKGQAFTDEKASKLREALQSVLKELTPEDKSATEDIEKDAKHEGTQQINSDALMSKLEEISKAIGDVKENHESLKKRVNDIENIREPSQSVDGDGSTDVKKSNKGFWDGVV